MQVLANRRLRVAAAVAASVLAIVTLTAAKPALRLSRLAATRGIPVQLRHYHRVAATPNQVLLVTAPPGSYKATLQAYTRMPTGWVPAFPAMATRLGPRGFTATPHENDGYTPTGSYRFILAFGRGANPGAKLPYYQTAYDDRWVDDVRSPYYNTWQVGPANGRWHSAEYLSAYWYGAVFDFNLDPVVKNHNSAIFFHAGGDSPSGGCVTVAPNDLLTILRWLDPAQHPMIVMGPNAQLPA